MYYPYLYGLGSELLAIRDLVTAAYAGPVRPIIEPVKSDAGSLRRVLQAIQGSDLEVGVVVNPSRGQLISTGAQHAWWNDMEPLVRSSGAIPTLEIDAATSSSDVADFASAFPQGELLVTVRAGGATLAAAAAGALSGRDVAVVCHHNVDDAPFAAAFGHSRVVRLHDNFVRQARNADYGLADWFTDANRSFSSMGRLGFGDYTVMGSLPMNTRGGPAGAVVVHATYIDAGGDLWLEHYVSDTTDRDEGSAAGKLLEALAKLHPDRSRYLDSSGMLAFDDIYDNSRQTNLAMNKRLQIAHHIHVVGSSF